jgi:hypothetical protein
MITTPAVYVLAVTMLAQPAPTRPNALTSTTMAMMEMLTVAIRTNSKRLS